VLLFASTATSVFQGVVLLTIFSLGFSIPFLIFSFSVDKLGGFIKRTEKATKVIRIVAGVVLLAIGLLFIFNNFELFNSFVLRVFESSDGGYGVFESLY
jgi:cytochrome c-type biogenesis protein